MLPEDFIKLAEALYNEHKVRGMALVFDEKGALIFRIYDNIKSVDFKTIPAEELTAKRILLNKVKFTLQHEVNNLDQALKQIDEIISVKEVMDFFSEFIIKSDEEEANQQNIL